MLCLFKSDINISRYTIVGLVVLFINYSLIPLFISVNVTTSVLALLIVNIGISTLIGYWMAIVDKIPYVIYSTGASRERHLARINKLIKRMIISVDASLILLGGYFLYIVSELNNSWIWLSVLTSLLNTGFVIIQNLFFNVTVVDSDNNH